MKYFGDIGVRPDYQFWEIHLTRKINLSSCLGFFNVAAALLIFGVAGYNDSIIEGLIVLALTPVLFFINKKWGYVSAAYMFTFIGCFLFYFLSVKMGVESFAFIYYFTLATAVIQMMARKEMLKHLFFMLLMCILSVALVVISFHFNFFEPRLSGTALSYIKYINIFFAFFTSACFMSIISYQVIQQEKQLQSALSQKEILLAELFHRVKNNLNIVTSLLNLKKGSVKSEEAQTALEDCRSLIYSMSLVHNKTYNNHEVDNLNFKEYLEELGRELVFTLGGDDEAEFLLKGENINLDITNAIPCALIFNELVTNSFKHGRVVGQPLKIEVGLTEDKKQITFIYTDNGPGLQKYSQSKDTLGLGLIQSLCEQINAVCRFETEGDFRFSLTFKH